MAKRLPLFSRKTLEDAASILREGFRDLAPKTGVKTSTLMTKEQAQSLVRLGMPNHAYRKHSNLSQKSENYSQSWQESLEASNVVYGAFASLGRIANNTAHSDSAINFENILNSINADGENNLHLDQKEAVDRIARRLIAAEKGGIRDLSQAGISAQDLQILTVAANALEVKIDEGVEPAQAKRDLLVREQQKADKRANGFRSQFNKTMRPELHQENVARLAELDAEVALNIDFEILQDDAHTANAYVRALSADLAQKLNPSFAFDQNAVKLDQDVEELGEIAVLNMAVGDAAAAAGLFTKAQQDQSGDVQALMIAIRNKAEHSKTSETKAKKDLGEFGGNIDFLGIAFKSDAERKALLADFGVSDAEFKLAQKTVEDARSGKGNVNNDARIQVPGIGIIQEKMFAKSIPTYPDFKTGVLIGQRAIESMRAVMRIQEAEKNGNPDVLDADLGAKRGFNFDPKFDAVETILAVQLAKSINDVESALEDGRDMSLAPETLSSIVQKFDFATTYLYRAGQNDLANQVQLFKEQVFRVPAIPEKTFTREAPSADKSLA